MNFGIVEYGRMGRKYASVLTSMKINISFVCNKISSEEVKKNYQDYKMAIDENKVDGIIISTYGPCSNLEDHKHTIDLIDKLFCPTK